MVIPFFIALVLGIGAIYWILLKNAADKIHTQYGKLAEAYNLELNQPPPTLAGFIRPEPSVYGELDGRELSISVPGKGLQNTRQIETVLKLALREKSFSAQITGSGLFSSFRQRDSGGMQRWKIGDEQLDAALDVRTNQGDLCAHLFEDGRGQALADLIKAGKGSIYIGGGVLAYAELGLIANEAVRERFQSVLSLFTSAAEAIEGQ